MAEAEDVEDTDESVGDAPPPPPAAVPVTLLSGFLGSGKTTLMQSLVKSAERNKVEVGLLVNDFAELGVDGEALAVDGVGETGMIELPSGCMCCSTSDGMEKGVKRLLRNKHCDHILIESSGVADANAIADALTSMEVAGMVWLASIVTVVDAEALARGSFSRIKVLVRQMEAADIIVMSKCDLLEDGSGINHADEVEESLRRFVKRTDVPILRASNGLLPLSAIFDLPLYEYDNWDKPRNTGEGSKVSEHIEEEGISSVSCLAPSPLSLRRFQGFLRNLPDSLLRAKGFVQVQTDGQVNLVEVQLSGQNNMYIRPVEKKRGVRPEKLGIVFIGIELDRNEMKASFNKCVEREEEGDNIAGKQRAQQLRSVIAQDARFEVETSKSGSSVVAIQLLGNPWARQENNSMNLALANRINSSKKMIVLPTLNSSGAIRIQHDVADDCRSIFEVWRCLELAAERTLSIIFMTHYCCGRCPF